MLRRHRVTLALVPPPAISGPKGLQGDQIRVVVNCGAHPVRLSRRNFLFFSLSDGLIPVCSILCRPFD
jgi:hypothetical protein